LARSCRPVSFDTENLGPSSHSHAGKQIPRVGAITERAYSFIDSSQSRAIRASIMVKTAPFILQSSVV
jgi:hypothetical protein